MFARSIFTSVEDNVARQFNVLCGVVCWGLHRTGCTRLTCSVCTDDTMLTLRGNIEIRTKYGVYALGGMYSFFVFGPIMDSNYSYYIDPPGRNGAQNLVASPLVRSI